MNWAAMNPVGIDLGDTLGAHPRERGVVLQVFQGVGDGPIVAISSRIFANSIGGERPQHGEAFHRAKRQVIARRSRWSDHATGWR